MCGCMMFPVVAVLLVLVAFTLSTNLPLFSSSSVSLGRETNDYCGHEELFQQSRDVQQ